MRKDILLFVNGQQHRVTGDDAFLTLSDFLRQRLNLCGTKIVCSEGDCGSCSVLCSKLTSDSSESTPYVSIDSCIRFVFQLDGCHLVTVEGLAKEIPNEGSQLSSVQQAMVDCHGSQCGFCTPGFVMAMTGILEQNESPSEEEWRRGLTGNLCRCTGYSPIIKAALRCNADNSTEPPGPTACPGTAGSSTNGIQQQYPRDEMLASVAAIEDEAIRIETDKQLVFCPVKLSEAVEFLADHPDAKIVSGATDVGVQFNKGYCEQNVWLDLNRVSELEGIKVGENEMLAGARATWTDFENISRSLVPQFHKIMEIFGSPQIRNVGTIGGNIINASPIADSIPFLFVCDAELELTGRSGTRSVNINDFYSGYKQFDLKPGELLTKVWIPLPDASQELRLYKVSRRRDLDISTFTAAIRLAIRDDTITDAAIAFGAVGPVVLRLPQTESFLCGKPFRLSTMAEAGEYAVNEITPISDVRGGADFRFQLAKNILIKFYHEVQSNSAIADGAIA